MRASQRSNVMHDNDFITRDSVLSLANEGDGHCVSIYMPTHRAGKETQQGPIRLKNLLSRAEEMLQQRGLRASEVEPLLKPIRALLEEDQFWMHQSDGLALFASSEDFRKYRLPIEFEDAVIVSDGFHIKPLLAATMNEGSFYLLCLSEQHLRLYRGSRQHFEQVDLGRTPTNIETALRFDDPESQLQWHSGAGANPQGAGRAAMFHGHGVGTDDEKTNLLRYFHLVADGVSKVIRDGSPLILAGVEYYFPIYKKASSYSNVVDEGIPGDVDVVKSEELHKKAVAILDPILKEPQERARERFLILRDKGQTLDNVEEVLRAASEGRVDTLFVPVDEVRWGGFQQADESVTSRSEQKAGDKDLFNEAAVATLNAKGTVYAVSAADIPSQAEVAAILRY